MVVSASTANLLRGHFELEPLDAHTLKGFTRPVELFRVLGPTGARTRLEAAALSGLTPHVGRQRESALLAADWQEVREGADRVVVIRGEAGIGKSRIIHQFRQTLLGQPVRVLEYFCSPMAQATSLAPVVANLEGLVQERTGEGGTREAKLEAVETLIREHPGLGADAIPLLAALLSIPGADERAIVDMSPARRRSRTLEVLRAFMTSSAERVPLALLVEDAHWADPSTLDLLDLIVRESPGGRTISASPAVRSFSPRGRGLTCR